MSGSTPDQEFWNRVDALIALANKQCDSAPKGKVSASMLFSAARFNAFVMAWAIGDKNAFSTKKEDGIAYYTAQFEKMLRENLDDYEANYDKYIGNQKTEG